MTLLSLSPLLFTAILFLQSGSNKVLYFKGNVAYFQDYFKATFLKNYALPLMIVITLLEILSGLLSLAGIGYGLVATPTDFSETSLYDWAFGLPTLTLLCLFFGQRIAKDYAGSANMTLYIIATWIGWFMWSFGR